MIIKKTVNGSQLTLAPEGRLDTLTAPELEAAVAPCINETNDLVFDFSKLEYISSAGLRVLLSTQKKMAAKGKFTVKGVNETVREIFEITGFSDILNIE